MKIQYFFFLAVLLLFSCKKKQTNPGDTGTDAPFSFTVNYNEITSSEANQVYYFTFNIKVHSGDIAKNKLTCTIEGLPPSVVVSPAVMVVGQLLGGVFTFDIRTVPLGDYPFILKVKSEAHGEQSYNLVLRIIPPPDYAPMLAGTFDSCYDLCVDSGFYYYASVVSLIPDTPFVLKISNIRGLGSAFVVRAIVSKEITIPLQTVDGRTIWGKGTYGQDARSGHAGDYVMAISDTIVTGIDTQMCKIHIEK